MSGALRWKERDEALFFSASPPTPPANRMPMWGQTKHNYFPIRVRTQRPYVCSTPICMPYVAEWNPGEARGDASVFGRSCKEVDQYCLFGTSAELYLRSLIWMHDWNKLSGLDCSGVQMPRVGICGRDI